ncbi:MAG TPA: indole-3-glycerol phosphate synthase TrpC [Bryobacteraceae bacterium]|nr:indole-3-glycerol phosphate synthase TrpC [Bryobacteraceae bacterium]
MLNTVPDILARIIDHKKTELADSKQLREKLEKGAQASVESRRNFPAALRTKSPAIIAEIKKASPSKGLLSSDFSPERNAREYASGGAAALSVLTDSRFFQGSLADLESARNAVSIPVLRKDFTIDSFHVIEAAAANADAILLIAAILSVRELRDLRELAATFRIASLVEVHDEDELSAALDSGAQVIGVNNRNLHTFEVNLETSMRLADRIPPDLIKVSESGIENSDQVRTLQAAGFHAFLVGEHLMRSNQPANAVRMLLS